MFWAFYNDYKKILKSRNSTLMGTLKEISKTDFILLVSIIFTALAYGVTITIWKEMWSFIFVVSFVLLIFIYCKRPKEKNVSINELVKHRKRNIKQCSVFFKSII